MRKLANEELNRLSVEGFKEAPKRSFCIVLDNVRSLMNVGSVFRTADAFLAEKIYLCGITGTPPHREIQKTALGATESVQWTHHPDTLSLVSDLKKEGWIIVALEQAEESIFLQDYTFESENRYALVFGNEVTGVSAEVVEACDTCIEIPQFGTKHSVNISVSVGMVLWQYFVQNKTSY